MLVSCFHPSFIPPACLCGGGGSNRFSGLILCVIRFSRVNVKNKSSQSADSVLSTTPPSLSSKQICSSVVEALLKRVVCVRRRLVVLFHSSNLSAAPAAHAACGTIVACNVQRDARILEMHPDLPLRTVSVALHHQ